MSDNIKVRAAPGLKVPRESQPHSYIDEHAAVDVPASAYYLRCLMYGDLVRETAAEAAKPAKKGENNGI